MVLLEVKPNTVDNVCKQYGLDTFIIKEQYNLNQFSIIHVYTFYTETEYCDDSTERDALTDFAKAFFKPIKNFILIDNDVIDDEVYYILYQELAKDYQK